MNNLEVAYDLANDHRHIRNVQQATLTTEDYGVFPEVALFGSTEWWAAVRSGIIPTLAIEGTISRVFMSGHNDFPEFEVVSEDTHTCWARDGRQELYQVGHRCRIEYVIQRNRKRGRPAAECKNVTRILIEP